MSRAFWKRLNRAIRTRGLPWCNFRHVKMTFVPAGVMVSRAGVESGLVGSVPASHSW